ncbi:MAG: phosphatase PAP2 family protein [Dehalococcoidia bacterium]
MALTRETVRTSRTFPSVRLGLAPRPSRRLATGTLALMLAAGLAALAVAVSGDRVPGADLSVARWVQGIDFLGWDQMLDGAEILTGFPVGVIIWLALVAGFWALGRPVEAIVMGIAPAIWLPKTILQDLVASSRPSEELLRITEFDTGFGFPSGHMTGGIAVFGILAVILFVRLGPGRGRVIALSSIASLLLLAAFSRVDSGTHWPSDVLGSLLLSGIWVIGMTAFYLSLRRGRMPLPGLRWVQRAWAGSPASGPDGVRLAGSIASTVFLDDAAGTADKVYRPSRPVRLLYWAAFQAPFPYSTRVEALRTAASVRELTGLLTRYWTGANMVAAVREIRREDGEYHFVTELVRGEEPADNAAIREELLTLRRHFAAAGLPTWQIDPENPHAHTNFVRTPDGELKIIDLESTLVPLIQPLHTLPRMLRSGRLPLFDDVDFERLRRYVEAEAAGLRAALGADGFARLEQAVADAEHASAVWKSQEPNVWGRAGQRVWRLLAWERRSAPVRRRLLRAEEFAMEFITKPLDRWVAEGRLSAAEAARVRSRLQSDATRQGMRHLGTAVIVSIPLRFPLGSLMRFALVLGFRYRAGRQYADGEINEALYRQARETHTWLVAAVALIPGLGAGAYLLSPVLRRSGNLIPLAVDQALYTLPFHLYARLRLGRLVPTRLGPRERKAPRAEAAAVVASLPPPAPDIGDDDSARKRGGFDIGGAGGRVTLPSHLAAVLRSAEVESDRIHIPESADAQCESCVA